MDRARENPSGCLFFSGTQYIDERAVMRNVAGRGKDHYYLLEELYSVAGMAASNRMLAKAVVAGRTAVTLRQENTLGPVGRSKNTQEVQ